MPTIELTIPRPLEWQRKVKDGRKRFNIVCVGRRAGKTELGKILLADPETLTYPVAWFAPTYKDMLNVWRDAVQTFTPIIDRQNASERRIELRTGGVIEFWSLDNPNSGRGRKYKRVIIDEAAFVPQLMAAWMHVILPTLADYTGDAWIFSTPKGRNGFYQLWANAQGQDDWSTWQLPSTVNPYLPDGEIENMRRIMPEMVFRQEIKAEFLEDAGGVFRRVMEAATAVEQDPRPGGQYVFGVDWGQQNDFTVIAVLDVATKSLVHIDRFNKIDYNVQRGRLKALHERYRPAQVIAEVNSIGLPNIDALRHDNMPIQAFTTTNATKSAAIDALALAFERSEIKILPDPALIAELQAYEMKKTATGLRSFSAPEGMHDDMVMALAMAWQGVKAGDLLMW
jgi:phage FluMu gp28-like protein